ncbi:hypothetical protein JTB14_013891 [Gonioctena quinquepunctata]|nr:hypothetical protein JTB14_013891 [Gonioctena quinquepunctata]
MRLDQVQEVKGESAPAAQASLPTLPVQIYLGKTDGVYNFRKGGSQNDKFESDSSDGEFQHKIYDTNDFQKDKNPKDKHGYDIFGDAFQLKKYDINTPQKDVTGTNKKRNTLASVRKPASPTTPHSYCQSTLGTTLNASEKEQTEITISGIQARIPNGSTFHSTFRSRGKYKLISYQPRGW